MNTIPSPIVGAARGLFLIAFLSAISCASMLHAATVILSDSFNRANGITASSGAGRPDSVGPADNAFGGSGTYYYEPIEPFGGNQSNFPIGASLTNNVLVQNGLDFGGIQYTTSSNTAATTGANIGQNLYMAADVFAPTSSGLKTSTGLYLRSRAAFSGDGIFGGSSSGYLISLKSTGQVQVEDLFNEGTFESTTNGGSPVVTAIPGTFNAGIFHHLELAANGTSLQVALDGVIQTFSQNGQVTTLSIPADGGSNNGTAGILFDDRPNRGQIGGQEADNIIITNYQPIVPTPEPASAGLALIGGLAVLARRRRD